MADRPKYSWEIADQAERVAAETAEAKRLRTASGWYRRLPNDQKKRLLDDLEQREADPLSQAIRRANAGGDGQPEPESETIPQEELDAREARRHGMSSEEYRALPPDRREALRHISRVPPPITPLRGSRNPALPPEPGGDDKPLRETIRDSVEAHEAKAAAAEPPSPPKPPQPPERDQRGGPDHEHHPTTKILDYVGLGLLLAPPAELFNMYVKGDPIDWVRAAVGTVVSWIAGGLVVWASRHWRTWPRVSSRVVPFLAAAENKFWVKALIMATFMALPIVVSPFFSTPPQPSQQTAQGCFGGPCPIYQGAPLGWAWEQYNFDVVLPPNPSVPMNIATFGVLGKNVGPEEVNLKDAYMVSGIDGTKLPLKVRVGPNDLIDVAEAGPVPENAEFALIAQFAGISGIPEANFLRTWGTFSVVIEYDSERVRHTYSRELIRSEIDAEDPSTRPRITRRKQ